MGMYVTGWVIFYLKAQDRWREGGVGRASLLLASEEKSRSLFKNTLGTPQIPLLARGTWLY